MNNLKLQLSEKRANARKIQEVKIEKLIQTSYDNLVNKLK